MTVRLSARLTRCLRERRSPASLGIPANAASPHDEPLGSAQGEMPPSLLWEQARGKQGLVVQAKGPPTVMAESPGCRATTSSSVTYVPEVLDALDDASQLNRTCGATQRT